jgi:hypothetical protein
MKTEDAFFDTQLQVLLLKTLKHKSHVLRVLLRDSAIDTNVVEVNNHELV